MIEFLFAIGYSFFVFLCFKSDTIIGAGIGGFLTTFAASGLYKAFT